MPLLPQNDVVSFERCCFNSSLKLWTIVLPPYIISVVLFKRRWFNGSLKLWTPLLPLPHRGFSSEFWGSTCHSFLSYLIAILHYYITYSFTAGPSLLVCNFLQTGSDSGYQPITTVSWLEPLLIGPTGKNPPAMIDCTKTFINFSWDVMKTNVIPKL